MLLVHVTVGVRGGYYRLMKVNEKVHPNENCVITLKYTKEDILKNVGNRAVLGHSIVFPTMEVNGAPKQPGYKLSLKYLRLCSA